MKKIKGNVSPMNRNIRVHSKRGSSFRTVHWSNSVWVPHCKGNVENPELRGQAKRVGTQEACLGRKEK